MADNVCDKTNTPSRELSHTSDGSYPDQSLLKLPANSSSSSPKPRSLDKPSPDDRIQSAKEVQRKPRGRPPGSKNKPKRPSITTDESESYLKPAILEISAGSDIIEAIIGFALKNDTCITLVSATGSVSNVTFRQQTPDVPPLSLHGTFNLIGLWGSFLGSFDPKNCSSDSSSLLSPSSFGISLAGPERQVFGGIVAGKVVAASIVVVVAATFRNPTFDRLPTDHDEAVETETGVYIPATDFLTDPGMPMAFYGEDIAVPMDCQMSPDILLWDFPPRPYF
ncbi:AT-hook motif nuclear-localized protein 28 [Manihot esculenta]|uniref:PPC domain-containing protein n=1 Tax=Manihot esculenta TaxID=3983 RepID=A0A2C9WDP9_MANES|nr:AT-hook motif nuclear-localized protein 28 [Manihot esculenta]OAY57976.1 hypothetical protein MANES_02G139600v8 [Manihot esculenta]